MKYGFGIDLGGTTVKLGLFNEQAELLHQWEIPTDTSDSGKNILPDIAEAILCEMEARGIAKSDVLGAGIGVPGPVSDQRIVNNCINLGWGVVDLKASLGALLGMEVRAGNDANVAALGEYYQGAGKGHRSMVLATLGTGIGGGIILNGQILEGAHGAGAEIGHMTLNREEREACGCGKYGCAEEYGSATGIARTARRYLASHDTPSPLRDLAAITAKDVFDQGKAGDTAALAILDQVYDDLGMFLSSVCCVIDPEIVVLGGGVCKAGQVLLDGIRPYFVKYMFHTGRDIPFALATLGNDAGIYGAVKMILN